MSIQDRAVQRRQSSNVATPQPGNVASLMARMLPQITRALPGHIKPDRFARLMLTTMRKTPGLLNCTETSLLGAIMEVARLGLDPSSDLVHLLPYRDKKNGVSNVEVIVGVRGFVELALRSGKVLKVESRAVCEGDSFSVDYGATGAGAVTHKPAFESETLTHAWARAIGKDGQCWIEVMSRPQIERIAKNRRGPWQTDFNEMARKTVLRRLAKQLPQSPELANARRVDDSVVVAYNTESDATTQQHFDRLPEPAPAAPERELPDEVRQQPAPDVDTHVDAQAGDFGFGE